MFAAFSNFDLRQIMFLARIVLLAIHIPPVQIILLIVSVVSLTINRALPATLSTIRQQLVEAHLVPEILACSSAAPQLNLVGWA